MMHVRKEYKMVQLQREHNNTYTPVLCLRSIAVAKDPPFVILKYDLCKLL